MKKETFETFVSDKVEKTFEYVNKENILKTISEESIFEKVLNFKPKENEFICSPLREDNNPGAFFKRFNGRLYFIDWADPINTHMDCFEFIKRYYNLTDFYSTLLFIKNNFDKEKAPIILKKETIQKRDKKLLISTRNFNKTDNLYWNRYGITTENLIEDKVYAVRSAILKEKGCEDKNISIYTKCYAYTNFKYERKKLYFPYKKGLNRFISTCTKNDIILDHLNRDRKQLLITKSYKDCRVLRNLGVNSIWFQNEGAYPLSLQEIVKDFTDVVIFFDNDFTGIESSKKLVSIINGYSKNVFARSINIDESLLQEKIKDASDLYFLKGESRLKKFLIKNKIEL